MLEALIRGTDSLCLTNISSDLGSPSSFLSSLRWRARAIMTLHPSAAQLRILKGSPSASPILSG